MADAVTELESSYLRDIVEKIREEHQHLNSRSREFLDSLEERVDRYGDYIWFTEKQKKWLDDLALDIDERINWRTK
jgi:hypothetical protein